LASFLEAVVEYMAGDVGVSGRAASTLTRRIVPGASSFVVLVAERMWNPNPAEHFLASFSDYWL